MRLFKVGRTIVFVPDSSKPLTGTDVYENWVLDNYTILQNLNLKNLYDCTRLRKSILLYYYIGIPNDSL